jgi:hypothetical protein
VIPLITSPQRKQGSLLALRARREGLVKCAWLVNNKDATSGLASRHGDKRMLNLILAVFWLCLGVGILVYQSLLPPDDRRALLLLVQVPGFPPFSAGWIALALTGWNLFRWWLRRYHREQLQGVHEAEADWKRRRRQILRLERRDEEYNPELDFRNLPSPPSDSPRDGERETPSS